MTEFNEKLEAEKWNVDDTLKMWYDDFLNVWFVRDLCTHANYEGNYVPPEHFYPCLEEFLASEDGRIHITDLVFSEDGTKLVGYRQTITTKKIVASDEGTEYLDDVRALEAQYGLPNTYSYAQEYLDYELYYVFVNETLLSVGLSIISVFLVVLLVTGSIPVTILVVLAVLLVDLFLLALMHYWDLTFNNVIVVNIVIAIGLAVDYSAHIAHTYLIIKAPHDLPDSEKRVYKARKAVSSMGSSVFHGGFSTFLAILALGGAKSYIFVVFFRMWFGIIVFGMANGFLLLPVILSIVGPIGTTLQVDQDPKTKV